MHIYCDRCGFETDATGVHQAGSICRVCGLGTLRRGLPASGFTITPGTNEPVPRKLPVPQLVPLQRGEMGVPGNFNYFSGVTGERYREFIRRSSVYVGRFTNILLPEPKRFAWLSPYTGNKHNRTYFTQLVLARVARAKFLDNGGRFPRLIEPFVGSGQIFLNASHWGPAFGNGMPSFLEVIGGDLNHYVIGAHRLLAGNGDAYAERAKEWDKELEANYGLFLNELERGGQAAMRNAANDPATARRTAFKYIWLVNRCKRGTQLTAAGGLRATLNDGIGNWTADIRKREVETIKAVLGVSGQIRTSLECRDFRRTTALATPQDIVFMDCPFPKFSLQEPPEGDPHPEQFDSQNAGTYGTGDDGAAFQTLILDEARRLVQAGTTVILCNFANPGLITAYSSLLVDAVSRRKLFTYTYRSPSTESEAYQLTVLPGANDRRVLDCPGAIMDAWRGVGGDDNTGDGTDGGPEEFFVSEEDRNYSGRTTTTTSSAARRRARAQAHTSLPYGQEDEDDDEGLGTDDDDRMETDGEGTDTDDDRMETDDESMETDDEDRVPTNPDGFTVGTYDDNDDDYVPED